MVPWSDSEIDQLLILKAQGLTCKEISENLGRSISSCRTKLFHINNPKYNKQYYQDNLEKIKEQNKQYRENNLEKIKEYNKQYYQDNKGKIKEYHKQYYQDNFEKIKEQKKQYRENNLEKIKEQNKQYRENNLEKIKQYHKQYNKQYYQDNKGKIKEYNKQYRENNLEKIKEQNKQYYQDNKEKIKEYNKQYYQDNKGKIKKRHRKYRAEHPEVSIRKERYKGEFTHINEKFQNNGAFCQITNCDEKVYDLEMHHIIPVKDNKEFWESCSIEEVLDNTILLCKPLHKNLHSYCGYKTYSEDKFYKWLDQLTSEKIDKILSNWDLCDGQVNLDTF